MKEHLHFSVVSVSLSFSVPASLSLFFCVLCMSLSPSPLTHLLPPPSFPPSLPPFHLLCFSPLPPSVIYVCLHLSPSFSLYLLHTLPYIHSYLPQTSPSHHLPLSWSLFCCLVTMLPTSPMETIATDSRQHSHSSLFCP